MFCEKCGAQIEQTDLFCQGCGAKNNYATDAVTETASLAPEAPAQSVQEAPASFEEISSGDEVYYEPEAEEFEETRPKTKKLRLAALIFLILAACAGGIAVAILFLTPIEVNLADYYSVEFEGVSGYATATVRSSGDLAKALQEKSFADDSDLLLFALSVEPELSKSTEIENGETITVDFTYDSDLAKELRLKLTDTPLTASASGLEELPSFDPFESVSLNFSGYSKLGTAEVSADLIQLPLTYTVEENGTLANGDTVKVTVQHDPGDAIAFGCRVTPLEKEFPVSGLTELDEEQIFAGMKLSFSGEDPDISVTAENISSDPDFSRIEYTATPAEGLSEGDAVKVTATLPGQREGAEALATKEAETFPSTKLLSSYADLKPKDREKLEATAEKLIDERIKQYSDREAYERDFWQMRDVGSIPIGELDDLDRVEKTIDSAYVLTSQWDNVPNKVVLLYDVTMYFSGSRKWQTAYFSIAFDEIPLNSNGDAKPDLSSGQIHRVVSAFAYPLEDLYEESVGIHADSHYIDKTILSSKHAERIAESRDIDAKHRIRGICYFSYNRYLIEADVRNMSSEEIHAAANAVYAHYGVKVSDPQQEEYFLSLFDRSVSKDYGTVNFEDFDETLLTEYDKYNLYFIEDHHTRGVPANQEPDNTVVFINSSDSPVPSSTLQLSDIEGRWIIDGIMTNGNNEKTLIEQLGSSASYENYLTISSNGNIEYRYSFINDSGTCRIDNDTVYAEVISLNTEFLNHSEIRPIAFQHLTTDDGERLVMDKDYRIYWKRDN